MIVRHPEAKEALCITQIHHSEMTGALAAAWNPPGQPAAAFAVAAARLHDIGWLDWEGQPDLDPETGHPFDFLNMAKRRHLEIWRNGFRDACALHPLLGLLVLRHNMMLAGTDTQVASPLKEELETFFADTSKMDTQLEHEFTKTGFYPAFGDVEAPLLQKSRLHKKQLKNMNAFILLTDYISLRMCMGPHRPNPFGPPPPYSGQEFRFEMLADKDEDGAEVGMMAPWPFAGRVFEWRATAWRHQRGMEFSGCRNTRPLLMRLKPFPG